MALSSIDAVPALVVVDLQKGLAGMSCAPHSLADVIARSAALAAAFRTKGLAVVLVSATGTAPGRTDAKGPGLGGDLPADFADIVDELRPAAGDVRVTKQTWGAFHRTGLDEVLRGRAVTQVVITGVATSAGVESTARSAHEHGYNVVVATDAVTDRDVENHDHSIEKIFPRLAETAGTAEILELLDRGR